MVRYRPHEILVSQARRTSQLWRLGVGVALTFVGFLALNAVYFRLLQFLPEWRSIYSELSLGTTARAIWIMLGNFGPLLLALAVVLNVLHQRTLGSLLGPTGFFLRDGYRVVRVVLPLFLLIYLLPTPDAVSANRNMPLGQWLSLLLPSLALIALQVSTEELVFRGYLQGYLAARFASPMVWMVVPSVLFAYLHYDPRTFGANAAVLAVWTGLFALAAADLTARCGNLGPAIALHMVNNVGAMMFVSMEGYWDGIALFVVPFSPSDVEIVRSVLPVEAMMVLCGWLAARIAIRR